MPKKEDYKKYRKQTIEYNKEWNKENPEKHNYYQKQWRRKNLLKAREIGKRYDKSEKGRKRRKEWLEKNRERLKEYFRLKAQEPKRKEQHKVQTHKRRAIIKNLTEHFTLSEWEELKKKWNYTCLACGKREPEIKLSPDHIIPLSQGGKNTINNIQPLCLECNLRKNKKIIDYRLIVK